MERRYCVIIFFRETKKISSCQFYDAFLSIRFWEKQSVIEVRIFYCVRKKEILFTTVVFGVGGCFLSVKSHRRNTFARYEGLFGEDFLLLRLGR